MECVLLTLDPAAPPPDWNDLMNREFICASCLKKFPAKSTELFLFPELDYFFHRHPDRSFYRALMLTVNGNIRIAQGDSDTENVLQLLGIYLDGAGGYKSRFTKLDDLRNAAKKFFEAMRTQKRKIEKGTFYIGSDGVMHFT